MPDPCRIAGSGARRHIIFCKQCAAMGPHSCRQHRHGLRWRAKHAHLPKREDVHAREPGGGPSVLLDHHIGAIRGRVAHNLHLRLQAFQWDEGGVGGRGHGARGGGRQAGLTLLPPLLPNTSLTGGLALL